MDEQSLIDRWIEVKQHNDGCSEYTVYAYRRAVLRLQAFLADRDLTLLAADAMTLEEYAGRYLHEQKLSPITRRIPIAAIRGFYSWLTQHGVLDKNPAACLNSPRIGHKLPKAMPLAAAQKLLMQPGLDTFTGCRDTAMIAVLLGTGCRVSGLTNLNERNLIWTTTEAGTERLVIRVCEKGKKERLVPVPFETALLVRAYLGHPALDQINRTLPNGDQALFVASRNYLPAHEFYGEATRLKKGTVCRIVHKHAERCGIAKEYSHPHALRHLYGTELAESGVDLLQRQALLGHQDPKTTEIYTHLAMRSLAAIVDQANPLRKMQTPVTALAKRLRALPK